MSKCKGCQEMQCQLDNANDLLRDAWRKQKDLEIVNDQMSDELKVLRKYNT